MHGVLPTQAMPLPWVMRSQPALLSELPMELRAASTLGATAEGHDVT